VVLSHHKTSAYSPGSRNAEPRLSVFCPFVHATIPEFMTRVHDTPSVAIFTTAACMLPEPVST
jgi:hypothetical protein